MVSAKRILLLVVLVLVSFELISCSSFSARKTLYVQNAHLIPPLVIPPGVAPPKQESLYNVPMVPNMYGPPPSIEPPGSHLHLQQAPKPQPQKTVAVTAPPPITNTTNWTTLSNGAPALLIPANKTTAWAQVGRALRSTKYQILDQDNLLASYYVLDTKATNNKITAKTPIYRVKIVQTGKTSQAELFDAHNNLASPQIAQQILGAVETKLG